MSDQAAQVPLLELLERVPADARVVYEHTPTEHSFIPVGRYCREAAAALRAKEEENARLERLVYVPGLTKCAKCSCVLMSTTLYVDAGKVAADNTPQQCPNGCGPMWRVTERDAGNDLVNRLEAAEERIRELEADARESYRIFKDGDQWCAVAPGFVNLQESPAAFDDGPALAFCALMEELNRG